tara:strand:- start:12 stop:779 length:768 start_codon:yes stop_codon:yes gene_type:complete
MKSRKNNRLKKHKKKTYKKSYKKTYKKYIRKFNKKKSYRRKQKNGGGGEICREESQSAPKVGEEKKCNKYFFEEVDKSGFYDYYAWRNPNNKYRKNKITSCRVVDNYGKKIECPQSLYDSKKKERAEARAKARAETRAETNARTEARAATNAREESNEYKPRTLSNSEKQFYKSPGSIKPQTQLKTLQSQLTSDNILKINEIQDKIDELEKEKEKQLDIVYLPANHNIKEGIQDKINDIQDKIDKLEKEKGTLKL